MPAIVWPLSSSPGELPAETQGRLMNLYAMKEGEQVILKQTPGLTQFATGSLSGFRGGLQVGNALYVAWQDKMVRYDAVGGETVLSGTFDGTGPITMFQNNKLPTPDVVAIDRENGAYVVTTSSVSSYADPDLPVVNSGSILDGFGVMTTAQGQIWCTDLNSLDVDGLSFAGAESKPDGLTRGFVSGQLFYAAGPESTEIWQNIGETPFPLGRVAVQAVGIRGPWAVAGDQIGWDSGPIMVANDGTVRHWNGYQPQVISTPAIVRDILSVADVSDLRASVHVIGDMGMWVLRSPDWTWAYNVATKQWHQVRSRDKATWRSIGSVKAFDRWITGDSDNSTLWAIDGAAQREGLIDIPREVESLPIKGFPAQYPVFRADFDVAVGQGIEGGIDPIQTEPTMRISWSDDGGNTWARPVVRGLGRQGKYRRMVSLSGVGRSSHLGRRWRLEKSDPIYWSILGSTFNEKLSAG
jgi:hypothetical protein